MTSPRLTALALGLAAAGLAALAAPAAAEPARHGLVVGGAVMVGGFADTNDTDDTPSGYAPAISVEIGDYFGRRSEVSLQLQTTTTRDRHVADPFDPQDHDLRISWLEAAVAYRRYLGPHGWLGLRLAYGRWWTHEYNPYYTQATYRDDEGALGVRFGYDVHESGTGAVAILFDADFIGDSQVGFSAGVSAMFGIAYQWRQR